MRATLYAAILSILLLSIPKLATSQTRTNSDGTTTTIGPSNEYGEGGKEETVSGKDYKVVLKIYYDKCGRTRRVERLDRKVTSYYSPDGDGLIAVERGEYWYNTIPYKSQSEGFPKKLDPDNGKSVIEDWNRRRIPPCPEPAQRETDHPEKPKEQPNPLGKLLQNVNIGIGVSGGGHTVGGHDDHRSGHDVTDQKHTRSSTTSSSKKAVTSMCVCHPCTCSPCRCH